jgi:glycosyltransferase involved in cell wall biosynthesis
MSPVPRCSVIIPTYNRAELLRLTLESLARQDLPRDDFEVLVVDDGSADATAAVADSFRDRLHVRRFFQEDQGWRVARARNIGIGRARGGVCAFVDSGVILHSGALAAHLASHDAAPGPAAVIGYVYGFSWTDDDADELRAAVTFDDPDRAIADLAAGGRWPDARERFYAQHGDDIGALPAPWVSFWTCNVSAPTALVRAAGGFDEAFTSWGGEDLDLGYRLHRDGARFVLNRAAAAIHCPHPKGYEINKRSADANYAYLAGKYRTPITALLTTEWPLVINAVALARGLPRCADYAAAAGVTAPGAGG